MCYRPFPGIQIPRFLLIFTLAMILLSCSAALNSKNNVEEKYEEFEQSEEVMEPASENGVIVGSQAHEGQPVGAAAGAVSGGLISALIERKKVGAVVVGAGIGCAGNVDLPRNVLMQRSQVDEYEVKLLVRDYLKAGKKEYPHYGYYNYLIFSEKTRETYDHRIAAARAFMCQFQDVFRASISGLAMTDLAVLYAPVNETADTIKLKTSEFPTELLDNYNYTLARAIVNSLAPKYSFDELAVSIIASPIPLGKLDDIPNPDLIEVISLTSRPPLHVAKIVSEFRRSLICPTEFKEVDVALVTEPLTGNVVEKNTIRTITLNKQRSKFDFSLKFRNFIGSIGKLILSITPNATAEDLICK